MCQNNNNNNNNGLDLYGAFQVTQSDNVKEAEGEKKARCYSLWKRWIE